MLLTNLLFSRTTFYEYLFLSLEYHYYLTLIHEDINTNDTSTSTRVPVSGPITHTHAHHINHQVSSLLRSCPSYLDHGDVCTLVLVRNQGEDRKGQGFAEAEFGLQDSSNLWWSPRSHTDSDWGVQVLHGILMKSIFIWIQTHVYILPEASSIIKLIPRGFSVKAVASPYFVPMGLLSSRVQ